MSSALDPTLEELLRRFREGSRLGLSRAISAVENQREGFHTLLHAVVSEGPSAARVGITGPPGAGKSSLVATLARTYRDADERVGVVAVDPTSPYSGGALLGDRIRMNELSTDPGIFIRSMATRGSLGGLATTTKEVIDIMDGFGLDRILIESVGVGQTELEITGAADTVVVLLVPESGDAIQAMKAGLMEIADVFVVNKADRPGADRLVKDIRQAMHLRAGEAMKDVPAHHGVDVGAALRQSTGGRDDRKKPRRWTPPVGWRIPVIKTVAHAGEGVDELLDAIERHRTHLSASGEIRERRLARAEDRVRAVVERELRRRAWADDRSAEALERGLERIAAGSETPYSVATRIVDALLA